MTDDSHKARGYNIITHEPNRYSTQLNRIQSMQSLKVSPNDNIHSGWKSAAKDGGQNTLQGAKPFHGSTLDLSQSVVKRPRNFTNIESTKLIKYEPEVVRNFDRQISSKHYWNELRETPKEKILTINHSSVPYDFVTQTHQRKIYSKESLKNLPAISNRTKFVAEIADLKYLEVPPYNPDYRALLQENQKCFYRGRGTFARFLDDSHKAGRLNKLFPKPFIPKTN